jgi:hypothetical protein
VEFHGDDFTKQRIESIISRELRKLGDVQLVSDRNDAADALLIIGLIVTNASGGSLGFAFSAVATVPKPRPQLDYYQTHWLFTGSGVESLESNCTDLVASFDREALEGDRIVRGAWDRYHLLVTKPMLPPPKELPKEVPK